ncbi:Crp/Fnr family transcriptional regulator [Actinophytocola oryzae]|uniref:CRP-like cAMP-binding protein n=1 Tax=Actinophytocola oryzae TaxID=502181 RepID=A0A4R7VR47_9PSEU|nr:Crp/Fnr family transcriptional regulator [Actinophytocola oryzae]TDV52243.1 CRP-like cAMP-binding protein [Actinophytocola oryzae]
MAPSDDTHGERRAWLRLRQADRTALTESGYERTWLPGEILALEGSPPSSMYVILEGWVKITARNYRGEDAPLAARGPAEIVGELSPISQLSRSATITALDKVRTLVVPHDRLLNLLQRHPGIARELLRTTGIRLQQSDRLRLESGGSDLTQRLAAVLLELAVQYYPDWTNVERASLNVTQEDLASYARVSRRTLLRGLDDLKRLSVIATGRHRVTITEPHILRDLAAGNPPPP